MADEKHRGIKSPLNHKPAAVRRARERLGITRTELGNRVGASVSLISEIEKGTRNATPAMILKLARELGCSPDTLRRRRLGPPENVPPAEAEQSEAEPAGAAA